MADYTAYHSQYLAHRITLEGVDEDALAKSLSTARVDMNPHQVDAALFALQPPIPRGAILADEVGLGKTIEAGLVIAQRWAEGHRRILLIVPASLRKQWTQELFDKFGIPASILEAKSYKERQKQGHARPFEIDYHVVVTSYEFGALKADDLRKTNWNLVIFDEALKARFSVRRSAERTLRSHGPSRGLPAAPAFCSLLAQVFGLRAHECRVENGSMVSEFVRVYLITALTALTFVAVTVPLRAEEFLGLGVLPGGTFSQAFGISADGSVVVGLSTSTAGPTGEAFRWSSGTGMVGLGFLPGYTNSSAVAASADGSVVVGSLGGFGGGQAFIWSGGIMSGLGFLPGGANSTARGVNADGSVVVGSSDSPAGYRAFRWAGGVMNSLGVLPGGTYSEAYGINADGSVVIGYGSSTAVPGGEAFRWTQSGGISGLGVLAGGTFSVAYAVNAVGSVVVGYGDGTASPSGEAFRWSSGTGIVGLGFLPGGTFSEALAVNADGSVVVGDSDGTAAPSGEAFRWTQSGGMKSIKGLLVTGGVNMTGWTLNSAQGVSADGTVIVGVGSNPSNTGEAWLARFSPEFGVGIITPGVVAQSFSGQAAMGKTGNAAIGGTLSTMNEYATQAKQTQRSRAMPFSVFGYGAYDSDPVASGLLGMTVDLPRDIVVGATIGANTIKTDMVFNGSAKMSGGSAGAFVARVPDAGLQWLAGIGGTAITGDVTRGYLNGNDLAYSKGSTSGRGIGATARLGWAFKDLLPKTQLTPFASYTIASTSFDGYIETAGPFPAQLGAFTSTAQTSRLGADARYTFAPGRWLWGTAAWAHRLDGGKSPDISGTLIGLFSMTVPGISSSKDWAELTGGVRLPVWDNGAITASVTTSLVPHQTTTYVSRLGITQAF